MEGEEVSSPEFTEIRHRRVLSDTTPFTSPRTTAKPRQQSLDITTHKGACRRSSTSHLYPEERPERAGAAQGLKKGDKRRMQNKLAQRAFRARTKIVKNDVHLPFPFPLSCFMIPRSRTQLNIIDDIVGWTFGTSRTTQQTTSGTNWKFDMFSREITNGELLYEICEISGDVNEEWNEWP